MKIEKGVYQRIVILSKVLGVMAVAISIDKMRSGLLSPALFYFISGSLISLLPEMIKQRVKIVGGEL